MCNKNGTIENRVQSSIETFETILHLRVGDVTQQK